MIPVIEEEIKRIVIDDFVPKKTKLKAEKGYTFKLEFEKRMPLYLRVYKSEGTIRPVEAMYYRHKCDICKDSDYPCSDFKKFIDELFEKAMNHPSMKIRKLYL